MIKLSHPDGYFGPDRLQAPTCDRARPRAIIPLGNTGSRGIGLCPTPNCTRNGEPQSTSSEPGGLTENTEFLLEGLKTLSEPAGGVPRRLVLGNASAAVASIGEGEERVLTEAFSRFQLYHRFEADFCGPARGSEKGNVENKVGYARRQWLCHLHPLNSLEELGEPLAAEAVKDMDRVHYKADRKISDLREEERSRLLPLPNVPFEAMRLDSAVLNNCAQFRFERAAYAMLCLKANRGRKFRSACIGIESRYGIEKASFSRLCRAATRSKNNQLTGRPCLRSTRGGRERPCTQPCFAICLKRLERICRKSMRRDRAIRVRVHIPAQIVHRFRSNSSGAAASVRS